MRLRIFDQKQLNKSRDELDSFIVRKLGELKELELTEGLDRELKEIISSVYRQAAEFRGDPAGQRVDQLEIVEENLYSVIELFNQLIAFKLRIDEPTNEYNTFIDETQVALDRRGLQIAEGTKKNAHNALRELPNNINELYQSCIAVTASVVGETTFRGGRLFATSEEDDPHSKSQLALLSKTARLATAFLENPTLKTSTDLIVQGRKVAVKKGEVHPWLKHSGKILSLGGTGVTCYGISAVAAAAATAAAPFTLGASIGILVAGLAILAIAAWISNRKSVPRSEALQNKLNELDSNTKKINKIRQEAPGDNKSDEHDNSNSITPLLRVGVGNRK